MHNPFDPPQSGGAREGWSVLRPEPEDVVAGRVSDYFLSEGYRLESGTPLDGMYGIGSNLLRILFGAFVRRYRFHVTVQTSAAGSIVQVDKGMSGAMGGAIGYVRMNKELDRVRMGVESSLNS